MAGHGRVMRPGARMDGERPFLDYWRATRTRLDARFVDWVQGQCGQLPSEHLGAIDAALAGGKRIRGMLVCLLCDALEGDSHTAVPSALAVECIQAASLIHDDYVDADRMRRNRPATWTVEGARNAVLLGDILFAVAIRHLAEQNQAMGRVIAQAIATTASGAYQERCGAGSERTLRPDLYARIIHLKTGALFGAAAQLGALSAQAAEPAAARAFRFGARLGEAYQMADDLCDLMTAPTDDAKGLALLLPILAHYGQQTSDAEAAPPLHDATHLADWLVRHRAGVARWMREEIALRVGRAQAEVEAFARGRYGALLRAAPAAVIASLQAEAASAPGGAAAGLLAGGDDR